MPRLIVEQPVTKAVSVRLDVQIIEALKELARSNRRPFSSELAEATEQYLRNIGRWPYQEEEN